MVSVSSSRFISLDPKISSEIKNIFDSQNTSKFVENLISKHDNIYYITNNNKIEMYAMITSCEKLRFKSVPENEIKYCGYLYNFIFKPESKYVETNKQYLDLLLTEIDKKHKKIVFHLPIDNKTNKLMHPITEYLGSKFNAGCIQRGSYQEYTSLKPLEAPVHSKINFEHYDPVGNCVHL
jgi:hypothetical protein